MTELVLNAHNKEEYPPAHTAGHILNATMVKMAGCPLGRNRAAWEARFFPKGPAEIKDSLRPKAHQD